MFLWYVVIDVSYIDLGDGSTSFRCWRRCEFPVCGCLVSSTIKAADRKVEKKSQPLSLNRNKTSWHLETKRIITSSRIKATLWAPLKEEYNIL